VNSVSLRGNWVVPPPLDAAGDPVADVDDDGVELLLLDGVLLHALTMPSASTATAAVPYLAVRHRVPGVLLVGLTCSNLLTSKSCDDPRRGSQQGSGRVPRRLARQPKPLPVTATLEGVFPF